MKKKLICLLLCLALLMSLLPASLAEDIPLAEPGEETDIPLAEPLDPRGRQDAETAEPAADSGSCGDSLSWSYSGGTLTISGSGDMWDFWEQSPGWQSLKGSITSLVVKNGVSSLGDNAFWNCSKLSRVSLPESLTQIGIYTFDSCALTSFTVPKNVSYIDRGAFVNNGAMTQILVESGNSSYKSVDGILFSYDGRFLHSCPTGKNVGAYTVPNGVFTLYANAFDSCSKLTAITLPGSLLNIESYSLSNCTQLKEITIPAGVTTIENYAFGWDGNLKTVTFTGSCPQIGATAFASVSATVYYPGSDPSWTDARLVDYGGLLTWVPVGSAAGPALKLRQMSTQGATLKWSSVDGATKYELQRKAGETWAVIATVTALTYTDTGLRMGESYLYRVRAYTGVWTENSKELSVLFNPFSDVSGTKTIEYVAWAYNNEIVKGTSDTTFKPDNTCTRIQFVMMLWKMYGSEEVGGTNPFSDISGSKTTKAILWALDRGVINSGSRFDPDGNITRVQIVMMLWKLAGSPNVSGENPFSDVSGSKTVKAVLWAYQKGITKGTGAATFSPDRDCTRVQLVIFLYKFNIAVPTNATTYRALLIGEVHFEPDGSIDRTALRNQGDVALISEMLAGVEGPEGGQYAVTCQYDLSNEGIKAAIQSTFAKADDNDVSLFFIASHGVTNLFSGTYAGALETIKTPGEKSELLPLSDLAGWLKAVPGKVIVVLGSCGSGAAIYSNDGGLRLLSNDDEAPELFNREVIEVFAQADPVANTGEFRDGKFYVLTAARHQENSYGYEGPSVYYNIFPYFFAKGGGKGKPADADKDGLITLLEMYNYTYAQSLDIAPQHAMMYPTGSKYPLFK